MFKFIRYLILATAAPFALAQVAPTASLTGTVTDPSGAAVPSVKLHLIQMETGLERFAAAQSDGHFLFSQVPAGPYSLEASASGFSPFKQTGFRLNVNNTTTLNIPLVIGSVGESVSVSAEAEMITTQSGALSQVIQQQYLQELPLNGRNAASLIRMVPGTVTGVGTTIAGYANNSDTINISVNGTRGNEVNYRLDGATHMDNVTNLNAAYPNPDALQEFSVQTSNYSAQFGNFSGAVVNVMTRSGSNQIRGSLFEFVRNGAMNARNYFAAQPDNLKRNQFGATVGGPILRNHLFWLGSYQGTIVHNTSFTNTATVPSAAMRRGDFNETGRDITDPATGKPFPNRFIPADRILPIATGLLSKVPAATAANGLLRYARPDKYDNHQGLGKLDYNAGKHQLSGSLFFVQFADPGWDADGTLLTVRIGQLQTTKTFKLQDVYAVRPNLLNTVVASGLMLDSTNKRTSKVWLSQFGPIKFVEPVEADRELEIGVTGYGGWGSVTNSPPGSWVRRNVEINDTVTWSSGRHTINAGGEYTPFTVFDSSTKFNQSGTATFSGQITGNGIGDLLLGKAASFTQSAGKFKQTRGKQFSLFAEDTYRASQRLTLTLGLRWDPYLPYHDVLGQVGGFRAGAKSERFANAPPGAVFPGDPGFPEGGMNKDWNNVSPRFGFAWQAKKSARPTVIRGGYGIFFVRPFPRLYNNFVESAPFSPTISLNGVDIQDPYGSSGVRNPFPPFAPVDLSKNVAFSFPMPYAYFQEDWGVGYSQAFNFTMEQQLASNWLLRLSYVGNKGAHLQTFRERNAAVYSATATVGNTNARRPLAPNFASVKELADAGNSNYHSFQATLDKRLAKRFSILAFYTFSKAIDDESANNQFTISNPNPFNNRFNRGVSDYDITHNFRVTGVFQAPSWSSLAAPMRLLVGGWSVSGILDRRSGLPFGISSGRDNSFTGIGLDRADLVRNPALPTDRPKADRLAKYFDPQAVTFNTVGSFGNSPRNFLRAPGLFNIDAALQKRFPLSEKLSLMLRGEFFNLLNHANFNQPGTNVSSPATLGVINGADNPRILQVGARITF